MIKLVEIDFTPEEFEELLRMTQEAKRYYIQLLKGSTFFIDPKIYKKRLNIVTDLYKRLLFIKNINFDITGEEEI